MAQVYVIGTCDTKGAELAYAKDLLSLAGVAAVLVDVSTGPSTAAADVSPEAVAAFHPQGVGAVIGLPDRGAAIAAMSIALTNYLAAQQDIAAVLGLGGSGNTAIVTTAMRSLPIGLPKLMVSTMASGNIAPYVGPTDIMMMPSVSDIAGLNAISRKVIGNAAHAIVGMVQNPVATVDTDKLPVALTMFGVTTSCITAIRAGLERDCECFVFHATGTGGQCMEKLIDSGLIAAALDITTTEVADHLLGGTLACTEDRFGAIIRTGIPYVGSVGAVDMVNFGSIETVPEKYRTRNLYIHNQQVTLMRTTPAENSMIGKWIAAKLNQMAGPVRFLLPLAGVSAIDAPGKPFHDPVADAALFDAIRNNWQSAPNRQLIEVDAHINDPEFAAAAVAAFRAIAP